jgi:hypothetical protein
MHAFRYCSLNGGGQNRYKGPEGTTEHSAFMQCRHYGAKVSRLFMPVNSPFVSRERGKGACIATGKITARIQSKDIAWTNLTRSPHSSGS